MSTSCEEIHTTETYQIIGSALEVLNTLGHGLLEKPYERALAAEFQLRGIPFQQQARFEIQYKGIRVGEYIPDLIAFDKIVIDTKTIDRITDHEIGQMINYLRLTKCRIGLILNFKYSRLDWKRIAL